MRSALDFSSWQTLISTAALVTSLRDFIRAVLQLDAIPASLAIPKQGPLRSLGSRDKGGASAGPGGRRGGVAAGGDAAGGGTGVGLGGGASHHPAAGDLDDTGGH